ncbi:MAG: DUF2513 domain-containing protein [Candidatus Galacturonibacter soehngenii]|nr:DUF2513 domain-containing protein [Candidatus Galacturonibacter soehngenii]
MKLNYECVRDILLTCESNLVLTSQLQFEVIRLKTLCSILTQYSKEEIAYTVILLDEAEYLECNIIEADNFIADIRIYRLTYVGHEFLETIRPDNIWSKIKRVLNTTGTITLPLISNVGQQIISNSITNYLQ